MIVNPINYRYATYFTGVQLILPYGNIDKAKIITGTVFIFQTLIKHIVVKYVFNEFSSVT